MRILANEFVLPFRDGWECHASHLLPLEDGKTSVYEIIPDDNFTRWNIPLMDMEIPHTISIITIIRDNNEVIIPNGRAVIKKGDKLLILTKAKNKNDVFKTFGVSR